MSISSRRLRTSVLLPSVLAAALGIGKAITLWRLPLRSLIMCPWLLDDTFIFMRIARNLATGRGYSFDGVTRTSGAPPLWIWITSLNHLGLDRVAAARVTLVESVALGAAAAVVVFVLARRLVSARVAWTAFALTAFLSPLFFSCGVGMETSLFTLLGLLCVLLYVSIADGGSARSFFGLGCMLGVTHLARLDGAFLTFAVVVVEAARLFRASKQERRRGLVRLLALVAGAALLSVPIALVSLRATGSLLPSNQVGRRWIAWEGVRLADGSVSMPLYVRAVVGKFLELQNLVNIAAGSGVLAALSIVWLAVRRRAGRLPWVVGVYLVSYFGALVFYQWFFPYAHGFRYLSLPVHLLSITIAAFLWDAVELGGFVRRARGLAVAALAVLLLSTSAYRYREVSRGLQSVENARILPTFTRAEVDEWWAMIDWMGENIPPGTVVGATDHGKLAYFTDLQVVDLEGILDPSMIDRFLDGSVGQYLRDRGVSYILLPANPRRLAYRMVAGALTLEEVEDAPRAVLRSLHRVVQSSDGERGEEGS